jgi:hypothetical protein
MDLGDLRAQDPVTVEAQTKPEKRHFRVRRAERMAGMAAQSWGAFWRDLGIRFLIMVAVVGLVALLLWIFVR